MITMKLLQSVENLRTNSTYTFFLEITVKLGRKVGNTRSIRSEDLFFRDHDDFRRKMGKYEIKDLFFREHQFLGILIWILPRGPNFKYPSLHREKLIEDILLNFNHTTLNTNT